MFFSKGALFFLMLVVTASQTAFSVFPSGTSFKGQAPQMTEDSYKKFAAAYYDRKGNHYWNSVFKGELARIEAEKKHFLEAFRLFYVCSHDACLNKVLFTAGMQRSDTGEAMVTDDDLWRLWDATPTSHKMRIFHYAHFHVLTSPEGINKQVWQSFWSQPSCALTFPESIYPVQDASHGALQLPVGNGSEPADIVVVQPEQPIVILHPTVVQIQDILQQPSGVDQTGITQQNPLVQPDNLIQKGLNDPTKEGNRSLAKSDLNNNPGDFSFKGEVSFVVGGLEKYFDDIREEGGENKEEGDLNASKNPNEEADGVQNISHHLSHSRPGITGGSVEGSQSKSGLGNQRNVSKEEEEENNSSELQKKGKKGGKEKKGGKGKKGKKEGEEAFKAGGKSPIPLGKSTPNKRDKGDELPYF